MQTSVNLLKTPLSSPPIAVKPPTPDAIPDRNNYLDRVMRGDTRTDRHREILPESNTAYRDQPVEPTDASPDPVSSLPSPSTLSLASQDVRSVIQQQKEHGYALTTKLNILFVTNGALLTSLTLSRLVMVPSVFSFLEVFGFLANFTLLINAFLPRQTAISPNLEDHRFLERYLSLSPEEYQLQMLVNLAQTYNANKQRLDDVSASLQYSAYVTWGLALIILLHIVVAFLIPDLAHLSGLPLLPGS
ncbi:hypothetical protein OOK60_15865 [Trichothermofontia sichuanensis B231]|uniref:hypothetical protein n=1 Tax=Trichothermofontia sichuanensis TaxID=3045816 RepID=UPI00224650EA|nr:hypothetical protein [Trichothermofontia sichuanensis]UZQ53948.1 hypothetical protein OOK60_15865 [Trichothermofontia sichuanensis B231]